MIPFFEISKPLGRVFPFGKNIPWFLAISQMQNIDGRPATFSGFDLQCIFLLIYVTVAWKRKSINFLQELLTILDRTKLGVGHRYAVVVLCMLYHEKEISSRPTK